MPRIPPDIIEAVRDKTDIVEVVGRHVKLQRAGKDFKGLCPFHQEKTPSFHVVPSKGIYHCFGCQAAGDVYRFLMEVEGLGFVEAVKELAASAGVEIPERELNADERRALRARANQREVMAAAAEYFESALWTGDGGSAARRYLADRGFDDELIRKAGIGWAPEGWTRLGDHLENKGYPLGLAFTCGLLRQKERRFYDAFRGRVMVPIRDERGRVIAFGGRILEGDGAKYINSTETPLYQKSRVLYGLDLARRYIGQKDRAILVEGYFDVLAMHQAGFGEAVATCGTALTPEHTERLRRLTQKVIVITDSDRAGAAAAEKMLPMLLEAGITSYRLDLPGAKDPDDLIREQGAEAMERALERSTTPLLTWVAQRRALANGYDAAGKERTLEELTRVLGHVRPAQASELAAVLRIDERLVLGRVRAAPTPKVVDEQPPEEPRWKPHRDVVHLLWLVVHRRDEVCDLVLRADPSILDSHAVVRPSLARLLQGEPVATVLNEERNPDVRRTLAAIVARSTLYTPEEASLAVCDVMARLWKPRQEARTAELKWRATSDARAGRADDAKAAFAELAAIKRSVRLLDRALASGDVHTAASVLAPAQQAPDEGATQPPASEEGPAVGEQEV